MKKFAFLFLIVLVSCNGKCDDVPTPCFDIVPENEPCDAYFERWFYNESKGTCEKVGYSGCEPYGFSSEGECRACQCDN